MRVVVTGGGTGGHIYPALAIAEYLRQQVAETEVLYIGTAKGLEADIVPKTGIAFETVEVMGLNRQKRKVSISTVQTLAKFVKGTLQARKLISAYQPDVVVGTGGFVCAPVVFSARTLGIPCYIHEMDAFPGLTNRFLSRFANVIGVSFAGAIPYFPGSGKKVRLVGNPRASEVRTVSRQAMDHYRSQDHLDPSKRLLVIVSGSRGASGINQAVIHALPVLTKRKDLQIVYITGQVHYDHVTKEIQKMQLPDTRRLHVKPFEYDMLNLLSQTDLIVSRAGGTTIAELTALGVPAIYIPSPYVANNHQEYNAKEVVSAGGGMLLPEQELSGERLSQAVQELLDNPSRLSAMREGALSAARPQALPTIYQILQELL